MNEKGREVLVAAALRGHPQVTGIMHGKTGDCALGVLHKDLHTGLHCTGRGHATTDCVDDTYWRYGLHRTDKWHFCPADGCGEFFAVEGDLLMHLNDTHKWDFLTIARKLPTTEVTGG